MHTTVRNEKRKPRTNGGWKSAEKQTRPFWQKKREPRTPEIVIPPPKLVDGEWVIQSVRARMEKKEKEFLQEKELATTPDVALASNLGSNSHSDVGTAGDDLDDGMGVADVGANGELGDDFSGYKRLQKGDLCELRYATSCILREGS
jgi:hypothetical protein